MEEKDPRRRRRQADSSLLRVCNFKMEGSESSLGILLTPLSPDVLIGGWPFDQGCIQRPLIFFPGYPPLTFAGMSKQASLCVWPPPPPFPLLLRLCSSDIVNPFSSLEIPPILLLLPSPVFTAY